MSKTAAPKTSISSVIGKLFEDYSEKTPKKIRLVDAYMFCILLTGIFQFGYCCLVGTFPFNAFLSGFISTVASFVLAGIFRIFFMLETKPKIFFLKLIYLF